MANKNIRLRHRPVSIEGILLQLQE